MKIAIAATTQALDAQVERHAARAPYYVLLDTKRDLYEVLANPVTDIDRGAGPRAASFLVQQGVEMVVAGEFGYRFRADLEENGITCEERSNTVADVIAEYRE
jgi:predicted Fe-Mo cluster-binding NifX family protein